MTARIHPITMPKWGIEMQEGTITEWHFQPGQTVDKGADLLGVETEKIVNAVEAPVSGTLRRIIAQNGETLPVGALIGVFAESAVSDAELDAFIARFTPADTSFDPESSTTSGTLAREETGESGPGGEARVSPIARRIAEQLGVDLAKVKGTGRHGRISKEDVEAYAASQGTADRATSPPFATEPHSRERLSSMRATIARRLLESSQTIPHYRLSTELAVDALFARREALKAAGHEVSLSDLVTRAVALALTRHPRINAQFTGEELLQFDHADIAIAVATASGLVTPIIRGADGLSVEQIAARSRDLAERAKAGKLSREEITGGTFTISNLGMFGITQFDAIINPPQVAILAVGAARQCVVPRDGRPVIARQMTVTLSCDHRLVDGVVGAAFLRTVGELVNSAATL